MVSVCFRVVLLAAARMRAAGSTGPICPAVTVLARPECSRWHDSPMSNPGDRSAPRPVRRTASFVAARGRPGRAERHPTAIEAGRAATGESQMARP